MGDVEQVVFYIIFALGILIAVRMYMQAYRKYREFINDPDKITIPGKGVYKDLKKGKYYIFVMHPRAFYPTLFVSKRSSVPRRCNYEIIDGADFKAREVADDTEIELEDCKGKYYVVFGRRSTFGAYSVRSFRLERDGDVELEVLSERDKDDGGKVFISSKRVPDAVPVLKLFGMMFLLILAMGALHILIMYILEQMGVVVP